jgi:hypothetical protein
MSKLIQVEEVSRREIIRGIALALTSAGTVDLDSAQHVHQAANQEKDATGRYVPKALTADEFKTIVRLSALIVPADGVSGSAADAGAPEFIDLLCSQNETLAAIYHGGLAWLDREMNRRYSKNFADALAKEQTAMLDLLVAAEREERLRRDEELVYQRSPDYKNFSSYTTRRQSDLGAGSKFFDWVRRMTVDAFYTSPIGVKDLDYRGNKGSSKYEVPVAALDHALKRSPFRGA